MRGSLGSQGHSIRDPSGVQEGNLPALQLARLVAVLLLLLALPLLKLMINDLTGMSHHLSTDFHSSLSQEHQIWKTWEAKRWWANVSFHAFILEGNSDAYICLLIYWLFTGTSLWLQRQFRLCGKWKAASTPARNSEFNSLPCVTMNQHFSAN